MPREFKLRLAKKEAEHVKGAPFKAVPKRRASDRQERRRLVVPTATRKRRLREPSPSAEVTSADDPDPKGNRDPVIFHHYGPALGDGTKSLSNAADISGDDSEANVVLQSGNWYCNVSSDGGTNWKQLDPTTIFPSGLGGGFCCDQIVIYAPRIDRFIWF